MIVSNAKEEQRCVGWMINECCCRRAFPAIYVVCVCVCVCVCVIICAVFIWLWEEPGRTTKKNHVIVRRACENSMWEEHVRRKEKPQINNFLDSRMWRHFQGDTTKAAEKRNPDCRAAEEKKKRDRGLIRLILVFTPSSRISHASIIKF